MPEGSSEYQRPIDNTEKIKLPTIAPTPTAALSVIFDQLHDDLDPKLVNFMGKIRMMESLQTYVEKRYLQGDRFLAKKGAVWVWKEKNGSQRGEVVGLYSHYKYLLVPSLQKEISTYAMDRSRSSAQEKIRKNLAVEKARDDIAGCIRKDFPEVALLADYAKFWADIYRTIEDGYSKYQLAKEFLHNSKITDPSVRRQIREMGFVLIHPRTGGFAWFAGGPARPPVRGTIEVASVSVTPEEDAASKREDAASKKQDAASWKQSELNKNRWEKANITDDTIRTISKGDSIAFERVISYLDSLASKNPLLRELNHDVVAFTRKINNDAKTQTSMDELLKKYAHDLDDISNKFAAIKRDGNVNDDELTHYADTVEMISMAVGYE